MKISTKGRMAIAAMLDIAIHETDTPVRLADIGRRQRVSLSYLEHLFRKLRQNGFVTSYRGPGGGYRLKRQLVTISVADVIGAVDGESLDGNSEPVNGRSAEGKGSVTDGLWRRVDDRLRDFLRSVTLDSVLADARDAGHVSDESVAPVTSFAVARRSRREIGPAAAIVAAGAPG